MRIAFSSATAWPAFTKRPPPGLKALLDGTDLTDKAQLSAEDISFRPAPALNAVGRLGIARLVIELLTTTSAQRASRPGAGFWKARTSSASNLSARFWRRAREMVAGDDLEQTPAIILADPDWHPGIVGIVASRLVDLYARPVLLIGLRQERGEALLIGQGSARSVPGFPLARSPACLPGAPDQSWGPRGGRRFQDST